MLEAGGWKKHRIQEPANSPLIPRAFLVARKTEITMWVFILVKGEPKIRPYISSRFSLGFRLPSNDHSS
jgi:hypothetical protein